MTPRPQRSGFGSGSKRSVGAWARFRAFFRWRAPRTLRFTRIGWTYSIVTFGVGLGALNTGNNLLYLVLGFMLSLIVASGVLSERCLRGLRVRRMLPDAVFAQEPFALRYQVTRAEGRAFAVTVRENGSALNGEAFVPLLEPGELLTARAVCFAQKRGPLPLNEVELSTAFPFGFFVKTRRVTLDDELVVYPRRGFVCADPDPLAGKQVGDKGNPRRRDGGGDLWGLRELQPNEDARRVHWMKSAAVGTLLKVEREAEERRHYQLSIDPALSGEALELQCEETAAMVHRLLGHGHEVGLKAGEHVVRPGSGPNQERRLLTLLAWLGFDPPENPRTSEAEG